MDEERKLQTVEGSENKAVIPLCCVDLYIARTYYRSVQRGVLICLARPPPPLCRSYDVCPPPNRAAEHDFSSCYVATPSALKGTPQFTALNSDRISLP